MPGRGRGKAKKQKYTADPWSSACPDSRSLIFFNIVASSYRRVYLTDGKKFYTIRIITNKMFYIYCRK